MVLVKVAFFSFLSFYTVWFGYNVANKDKIWKLGQPLYSGLAKVADFICYSQTVNLVLVFIEHTSILISMFINYIS